MIEERSAAVQRVHKVLEDCNIKLSSVATDVMGASGRDMIQALIDGEQDPLKLAALARGRLKAKRESLQQALHGHVTEHHRFMLRLHWAHVESLDRLVADLDQQIEEKVRPFAEIIALLDQVPGIGETAAKSLIAEIGVDMDQFPNQHHLASWAGMSPGNNECRQAQERHHNQRQSLVTGYPWRGRLCGSPHQAQLPVGPLSPLGCPPWPQPLSRSRRPQDTDDRLFYHQGPSYL